MNGSRMSICHDVAHPLVDSAQRLSALDARTALDTETPDADGWMMLSALARRPVIDAILTELPASRRGMRNVAAAQFAASLACCVVRPLMAMLHLDNRVPALRPVAVSVLERDGRFHGLALQPAEVYALPDDPAGPHPALRPVSGPDKLDQLASESIHAALAPVLYTVRLEGRYGLPRLWGAVLDMVGATSLLVARIAGLDQQRAWDRAERLCALVRQLAEQPNADQPRPFAVRWSGGEAVYTVKGTCCLQYREHGLRPREHTDSSAYCKTCPFLCEQQRQQQCRAQAERDMAYER